MFFSPADTLASCAPCSRTQQSACGMILGIIVQGLCSLPPCAPSAHFSYTRHTIALGLQPEWWASNFYGSGKMNNYNMRAGDLFDPPTQTVSFARNSTSNTRLQGNPVW